MKVKKEKLEEIITSELNKKLDSINESIANRIGMELKKLIDAWKSVKQEMGVQPFVLDQASDILYRELMATFATINKKVDSGEFSGVQSQKTIGAPDVVMESIQKILQERFGKKEEKTLDDKLFEVADILFESMEIEEKELSAPELQAKEKYVKKLKSQKDDFKKRYGDRWESVMYAMATKMAKDNA